MRDAVGPRGQVVILLNDDNYLLRAKGRVITPLDQRMAVLLAMRDIDMVIPFEHDTPCTMISRMEPNFWFKGPEYWDIDFPERGLMETYGGELRFATCGPDVHTSDIIRAIKSMRKL
jgi:bifunctional ADP-heptose synthase (sugar kinase/adenylyltransferase)